MQLILFIYLQNNYYFLNGVSTCLLGQFDEK